MEKQNLTTKIQHISTLSADPVLLFVNIKQETPWRMLIVFIFLLLLECDKTFDAHNALSGKIYTEKANTKSSLACKNP